MEGNSKHYTPKARIQRSLSDDVVYESLRDDIIKQRLLPAQHLFEPDLALRFNVSRTPIRTALQRLASEGLVELIPHKGALVKALSIKEISNLFQIRAALEKMAVENVCGNQDLADRLKCLMEQSQLAIEQNDVQNYTSLDEEFHCQIAEATGNEELVKLVKTLNLRVYIYRLRVLAIPGQLKVSLGEHQALTNLIAAGNVTRAGEAAAGHIDSVLNMLSNMWLIG